jgi:glycosyltransferase involved in cell wall biosynthesis
MTSVLLVGKGAPDRGGIPSFLQTLLGSELAQLHELTLLNVASTGTPQGGRATGSNLIRTAQDVLAVWRAARGHDVVHVHSALAPGVTAVRAAALTVTARARGCRVIVHAHGGLVLMWMTGRARRALIHIALAPAHRVVAVSSAVQHSLASVLGEKRVILIDNGIDVNLYETCAQPHHPPRILYVGLLTPRKGVLELLEASRILTDRNVAHELRLVGGTPDEGPEAEARVRAAVTGRTRLMGSKDPAEMPGVYREADVFCLPSWWEAMPLSVLEAMASGLAVVATDVGDVARAVRPGETGVLVPAQSAGELADALEPLLTDASLRQRLGSAGRRLVTEQFSSQATAQALHLLYESRTDI